MDSIKQYLLKQSEPAKYSIEVAPSSELGIIIVIPAYKEQDIETTLKSLTHCTHPTCSVEILIFVNGSQEDSEELRKINESCIKTCLEFKATYDSPQLKFHVFSDLGLLKKKSGVGRARKILMDVASSRFDEINLPTGVIVNLDADCKVESNYLVAIEEHFNQEKVKPAASIHFEHEITHKHILLYELHLRYFIGMQKLIRLPFAYQTVGSAMAVTAETYAKVGGMNTKQAGEDFYFMHKFIKNNDCEQLTTTTVVPSGRKSDRVPFGTGRAVGEMMDNKPFTTYNAKSFLLIQPLVQNLEQIYIGQKIKTDERLEKFLEVNQFDKKVLEIRRHTKGLLAFKKRFYQYFDAFRFMKLLHFLRELDLPDQSLEQVLPFYFEKINQSYQGVSERSLEILRQYDKGCLV